MVNFIETLKGNLKSIIAKMSETKELFVKQPEKDFTRKRKLPFEEVVSVVVSMGGNSIRKELFETYDYDADTATSSAFIQQRDKIEPYTFKYLFNNLAGSFDNPNLYKGFRVLAVDASDVHTPTNPDDKETHIKCQPTDKGYNVFHLNALYDLQNRVYMDAIVKNKSEANERQVLIELVKDSTIDGNVIVTADRGYENYNTFAHIERKGWNYVIRVKDIDSNGVISYLNLPKCGEFDITLHRILTRKGTKEVRDNPDVYRKVPGHAAFDFLNEENLFYAIELRVVRFMLPDGSYKAVVTNLPEESFTSDEIKYVYSLRWGIETSFRKLKHTVGLLNFHSKKRDLILQEIYARLTMYNFVEMAASHAVISKGRKQHSHKVNFTAALLACRRFLRICGNISSYDIEALICKNTVPIRPDRDKYPCKPKFRSAVCFVYRVA